MRSIDNSLAAQNSRYLQSVIDYVLDVKPYRTKLARSGAVSEEYVFSDDFTVSIEEADHVKAFLGADLLYRMPVEPFVRKRQTDSWYQELISDGVRRIWSMPNVTIPKLASHSRREKFEIGVNEFTGIPGLSGVLDQRRWDFSGITDVQVNDVHQQDSVDYFLSHGVFSFDTTGTINGSPCWIQHDLNHEMLTIGEVGTWTSRIMNTTAVPTTNDDPDNPDNPRPVDENGNPVSPNLTLPPGSLAAYAAFNDLPGDLIYADIHRLGGTLKHIRGETYEEFYAVCENETPATLIVYSPNEEFALGSVVMQGQDGSDGHFELLDAHGKIRIAFDFLPQYNHTDASSELGDRYEIVPQYKIVVHPDAPEETWSLIKVNPICLVGAPVWNPQPGARPNGTPAFEVHTQSLENATAATWAVEFDGQANYTINSTLPGYPKTVSLLEGCSYKDNNIAFTIIPTIDGWYAGDSFTFSTGPVAHYKVFGSVSGWTKDIFTGLDAQVGKWFWNGMIGFKIPKLDLFVSNYNSTISVSSGEDNTWKTVVSNTDVLTDIQFSNGTFIATGQNQVAAASADGTTWTSKLATVVTPNQDEFLIITGEFGFIATSSIENGEMVWRKRNSHVTANLNASTFARQQAGDGFNRIVVVGNDGVILSSIDGIGWARQHSEFDSTDHLYDVCSTDNEFIAVGANGTILRSEDRIFWEEVNYNPDYDLRAVLFVPADAFNPIDQFIAVGSRSSGVILRSIDGGRTWLDLNQFPNTSIDFYDVAYGDGKFMAVGPTGHVALSSDGEIWTSYAGRVFNSVAFGNGTFVGVGGSENNQPQFSFNPARPFVSTMAVPSTYTITFTKKSDSVNGIQGEATVVNNLKGYGRNLKTGQFWEDEWVSFKLDTIPGMYEYNVGDTVKVFIAPSRPYPYDITEFVKFTGYDLQSYDLISYDATTMTPDGEPIGRNAKMPYFHNEELYPLYHSHGAVIFPNAVAGDKVVIDKAFEEKIRFKIEGSSSFYPELGAKNDEIPLFVRYSDKADLNFDSLGIAEFSDFAPLIEAFSAATGERMFYLLSPKFNKTNRASQTQLVFDEVFFNKYMKFNTKYSIIVYPEDSYGQHIRVKISEALKIYARIHLDLQDIGRITFSDTTPTATSIVGDISFGEGPIAGYWRWSPPTFTYIAQEGQTAFEAADAFGRSLFIDSHILEQEANGKKIVSVTIDSVQTDQFTLEENKVILNAPVSDRAKVVIKIKAYASPKDDIGYPADSRYGWTYIIPSNSPNDQAFTYPFSIHIEEGGGVIPEFYDGNGYDTALYDESSIKPFFEIKKSDSDLDASGNPEHASPKFTEGLMIQMTVVDDYMFAGYDIGAFDNSEYDDSLSEFPPEVAGETTMMLLYKQDYEFLDVEAYSDHFKLNLDGITNPTSLKVASLDDLTDAHNLPIQFETRPVYVNGAIIYVEDPYTLLFQLPGSLSAPFRIWVS
jgi:photosystem II stability/assembly factor-like uncharacterized protein